MFFIIFRLPLMQGERMKDKNDIFVDFLFFRLYTDNKQNDIT